MATTDTNRRSTRRRMRLSDLSLDPSRHLRRQREEMEREWEENPLPYQEVLTLEESWQKVSDAMWTAFETLKQEYGPLPDDESKQ